MALLRTLTAGHISSREMSTGALTTLASVLTMATPTKSASTGNLFRATSMPL